MKYLKIIVLNLIVGHCIAGSVDSSRSERFSIHAQATIVDQYKPSFSVPYSGTNSLMPAAENRVSVTTTLFAGVRLWKGASFFINPEMAGGEGLSQTLGIALATNGETFRVGNPHPQIYLARMYFRQIFRVGTKSEYQTSDANQLSGKKPQQYISFTVGKVSLADYFDDNEYSHDARTQFLCWGLMDNGAWDYAANTRGYTPSVILEYVSPVHEFRTSASLLPSVANGNTMNWNLSKSVSLNAEYTHRHSINGKKGAIRLLGFFNTTNMGKYSQAIDSIVPVIENTRQFGRIKYGFTVNMDQAITDYLGCFLRAGWNDGNNETWAFTEIDHTLSAGLSANGSKWKRKNDNVGLAYVGAGISKPHRDYLKAGGHGFMLGDGNLNYSWEHVMEFYYSADLYKQHIFLSATYQLLVNPGYNKDRKGPVNTLSLRLHLVI